jgi:hypothetical protein
MSGVRNDFKLFSTHLGQIVANLSANDFRSTLSDFQSISSLTVKQFLTQSSSSPAFYSRDPIVITPQTSLFLSAEIMILEGIHRVWIIASHDSSEVRALGIGCLSLSDIIRAVYTLTAGEQES